MPRRCSSHRVGSLLIQRRPELISPCPQLISFRLPLTLSPCTTTPTAILQPENTNPGKSISGKLGFCGQRLAEGNSVTALRHRRTVVLGGVGGDSHSVGVVMLRRILERANYKVIYLSTQNSPHRIVDAACDVDAVLVSNMDGHARHYLADLPQLRTEKPSDAVWYLGGNPSVCTDPDEALAELEPLGFDRVVLGYIEPVKVLQLLDHDLASRPLRTRRIVAIQHRGLPERRVAVSVMSTDIDDERSDVLASWSTGSAAYSLAENAAFLEKSTKLADTQRRARRERRALLQPRTGVADPQGQRQLFATMDGAGADVLSFQVDSLTRNNSYEQVQILLKDSRAFGTHLPLNGFPLVNHGMQTVRALVAEHPATPFQVRHSTRDPRLLAEITYAAGVAAYEGGPLTYNLPYYRDYHPRDALHAWAYVEALTGRYHHEFNVVIDREYFGVLTAALVPPTIAVAVTVLEALFSAHFGVKSVSLGYAEQGHRVQDVTSIWAMQDLAQHYLMTAGHADVEVSTVFHQYMAAFPQSPARARELLAGSARTAAMSGATRVMLKTFAESRHIPNALQNAESLALVRNSLTAARPVARNNQRYVDEYERVTQEASSILDAILELPGGLDQQIEAAVARGFIDVPFSPSVWNPGQVMPLRDRTGAVRMAHTGSLPLPTALAARHRQETRRRLEDSHSSEDRALEHDILAVGRGAFTSWPLDQDNNEV